ncbi:hypothetical protein GCM10028806_33970 [Spirosoma terrae]|uniref:Uncharacterized protein n=1 Tax=Spirosoma terrae TaxID=1968276 RepID=A0A6L9L5N5_9BACT|nr:hypothetical protein [Spirosoma terrae]NDU95710.1 hypothetical protein [Spirosoma terrae]
MNLRRPSFYDIPAMHRDLCRLAARVAALESGTGSIPSGGSLESFVDQKLQEAAIYFNEEHFAGVGTAANPLSVIGGGGGGSGPTIPTSTPLTFGNAYTETATTITYQSGPTYHTAAPAQQVIPDGKKGRVWMRADNTDSDFILGLSTTGTGNHTDFVDSIQLSYFQGNQRILRWENNVQTTVKNTVVTYVGIIREADGAVKLQESNDNITWIDILTLTPMIGNVYLMLSMNNSGKVYAPKLTLYP